jgi:two-component system phosphate regulon sensor histidine kinase PhoR
MQRSLRWRITLSYIALVTAGMFALGLLLFRFVYNQSLENLQSNLTADAYLLADQVNLPGSQSDPDAELAQTVQTYSDILNLRTTIVLVDGQVIAESDFEISQMENHADRPEIIQALAGEVGIETRFSNTLGTEMLYVAVPIQNDQEIVGAARVAVSLQQLQQQMGQIMGSMLAISFLVTLLAVALAIILGNFTIRPLQNLTQRVIKMGNGGSPESYLPERDDEIQQLDEAFTFLTQKLNSQIDELKNERGKLVAVLTNMTDGVLIVDEDGLVQLLNPAAGQMFSISQEQGIGSALIEVVRNHQLVELWQLCISSKKQQVTTLEISPNRKFLQGIATPLQGAMAGNTLLVFQDLTRLRRLEMVRRDFVSNVSHELRTPLASLKALTETLMEGALEDPPAARRFLLRMEHEIDNLTQMVRELLELSRIESGRVPLEQQVITPYELLMPAAERMQVQAERAGLTISHEIPENLPAVSADPNRLEQVLVNLIHNAIKFTPPGGHITVGAYEQAGNVVFFIRDTGVGIESESLPRIFERFYKADRSRSGGGTGLGLSISRHLVEAHNGRIWAESKPGEGSTFFFSLPHS